MAEHALPGASRVAGPLALATIGAAGTALAIGVPTDIVSTPLFQRTTPERPWDLPLLIATSVLAGLLIATWGRAGACPVRTGERGLLGGGVLGFLAVGCPTCNHLVVLALGSAGALRWFEPLQPLLGVAGLVVLAWALWRRRAAFAGLY